MHILITIPTSIHSQQGNTITALRYKKLLSELGHFVEIINEYTDQPADLLIALHAIKSAKSIQNWRKQSLQPCILMLSGTDLYQDKQKHPDLFEQSAQLSNKIIILQSAAIELLNEKQQEKTSTIYQSVSLPEIIPTKEPQKTFQICVVGHLREVKNPFYTIRNIAKTDLPVQIIHIGNALSPEMKQMAKQWEQDDPRYTWKGNLSHEQTLQIIQDSDLLSHTSLMEGGANVIAESISLSTPIIASFVDGNRGMLGEEYTGYFDLEDPDQFLSLIKKSVTDKQFYQQLQTQCENLAEQFKPESEKESLKILLENFKGNESKL